MFISRAGGGGGGGEGGVGEKRLVLFLKTISAFMGDASSLSIRSGGESIYLSNPSHLLFSPAKAN